MNFQEALKEIKQGNRVQRAGWNGEDMYIQGQFPDENSKMDLPYIYIKTSLGQLVPWAVSHGDLFGEDWSVYQEAQQKAA